MNASNIEWLSASIRNHTHLFFLERVSLPIAAFPARFTSPELVVVRMIARIVALLLAYHSQQQELLQLPLAALRV